MCNEEIKYILDGYKNGSLSADVAADALQKAVCVSRRNEADEEFAKTLESLNEEQEEPHLLDRDELIDNIVNMLMYGDEEADIRGFRLDEIFDYMHSVNWVWFNEPVNEIGFKNILRSLVKECVAGVLDEGKEEWSVATAGLKVCCYIDEDYLATDLEFVADSMCHYVKLNEIEDV